MSLRKIENPDKFRQEVRENLYKIFSAHKKYKKQKNNYLFIVTT